MWEGEHRLRSALRERYLASRWHPPAGQAPRTYDPAMIRWLRAKLRRRTSRSDPEGVRRARGDSDRDNWKLWKLRTPPVPRR